MTFSLIISSPDGDLYRGDAEKLILRGSEGELAVLAGHVPFVTAVKKGRFVVVDGQSNRREGLIEAGLLTVDQQRTTVLTSAVHWNA
ncbi:MAG: F0F1 ATP synthase subunit epsilon [Clostridia bacterium]|nr:F0F1 ATP synthase subunit epsilon [Clostridia bacterium]